MHISDQSPEQAAVDIASTPRPAASQPRRRFAAFAGLAPLLAACLWGGMYVVSRASFSAIPPITLGLLRVIVGGLTLWIATKVAPVGLRPQNPPARVETNADLPGAGSPRRRTWWLKAPGRDFHRRGGAGLPGDIWCFLLLGGTLTATLITQFWGTALASAHDGALLTTMTPVFVVPIAWLVLRERPGWRVLAGMGLALVGVVIVVGADLGGGGATLLGDALLLISALAWALFTVLGAPLVRRLSALVTSTYATLWCIPLLLPFAAVELTQQPIGSITPGLVLAVLYLGWGATALAWFLWYKGVEHLDAAVAAIFFFAQPLVGGLLSALFLGETLSSGFWLGGAVLAGGILLASAQKK
jgi:drug/metabolite transporter (DMT)-like permease